MTGGGGVGGLEDGVGCGCGEMGPRVEPEDDGWGRGRSSDCRTPSSKGRGFVPVAALFLRAQAVEEELVEEAGGVFEAAFGAAFAAEDGADLNVEIGVVLGGGPD
ncbi:hypothetical protein SAMN04487974_103330 [Pelagibacterium luteolum]|uniref:Uncharacterized protein n=1 Tax=Pelagibacterium luteolum TaxID=440168 RepID=A0A1G7UX28_9HYPH|nr:hypothetical protein SAMN04487974_103330 [Pelagibacterium luteolum]